MIFFISSFLMLPLNQDSSTNKDLFKGDCLFLPRMCTLLKDESFLNLVDADDPIATPFPMFLCAPL